MYNRTPTRYNCIYKSELFLDLNGKVFKMKTKTHTKIPNYRNRFSGRVTFQTMEFATVKKGDRLVVLNSAYAEDDGRAVIASTSIEQWMLDKIEVRDDYVLLPYSDRWKNK